MADQEVTFNAHAVNLRTISRIGPYAFNTIVLDNAALELERQAKEIETLRARLANLEVGSTARVDPIREQQISRLIDALEDEQAKVSG